MQTDQNLSFTLATIFSAMAPVIAQTIECSERCQEIDDTFRRKLELSAQAPLTPEQEQELSARLEAFWQQVNPELKALCDWVGKLPELVQLQHQVQKAWRALEAQSSSFKANGALSPEEHEQGLEQIKPVMAQINGILQDSRMQLSALQAGADATIAQIVGAYLPHHDELIALINDPKSSAEVCEFMCMLDSL